MIDWDKDNDLLYEVKVGVNGHVVIDEEGLYLLKSNALGPKTNKIFKTKAVDQDRAEIKVQYKNGKIGKDPDTICVRSSAILPQIIGKMARDTDDELRMNCDNLSAVLNKMCKDANSKETLLEIVRNLPENDVTDIEFIETKIGDVIFALREKSYNSTNLVDARQLSDGTLRCIAVLTAVLMGEPGSMILIEEIDNGIHPARVYKLIDQLIRIGRERHIDIDNFPAMLATGGLGNAMIDESLITVLWRGISYYRDFS